MAVFTANKEGASSHGLKPKALSPEARAIADKLPTPERPQARENIASNLPGNLDDEVQDAVDGQGASVNPGSEDRTGSTTPPPYTRGVCRTSRGSLSAGADDENEKAAAAK